MFERFTDRARRSVVLAQEEARLLRHNYIGTEHLLLGLICEGESVAARALVALGLTLPDVRAHVEDVIGVGLRSVTGHLPFTPRARKVYELALRESLQLGHDYIGTEHILLGLIREGQGVGASTLVAKGIELTRARKMVIKLLAANTKPPSRILTITDDGTEIFSRRVDVVVCREYPNGTVTLTATYRPDDDSHGRHAREH